MHVHLRTCGVFWAAAVLFFALISQAHAQDAPADAAAQTPPPPPARVSLDLVRVLRSAMVFQAPYEDDVWTISPQPGRRFIQLPLLVEAADQPYDIGGNVVDVRGARFISFHLKADAAIAQGEAGPSSVAVALPPLAPLVTRKLTIEPGNLVSKGTLSWKLDRFIPNGTVKEGDIIYALKIDPRRFEALEPGAAPRVTKDANETAQAFQTRKRQLEMEHRAKQLAFRDRRTAVNDLPDSFVAPMPEIIWAIYEVPEYSSELVIGGVSEQSWAIPIDTLMALRDMVGTTAANQPAQQQTPDAMAGQVQRLSALVASGHPLSQRLAAYVVNDADLAAVAQPGDAIAQLLRALLTAQDREAKLVALTEVSSTVPPTAVTVGLIREFAGQFDAVMQLVSLRGLLQAELTNDQQLQGMIQSTNQMLANPTGPPPAEVLAALVESTNPKTAAILAGGLDFDPIPDARRAEAIRFLAMTAPTQPIAAGLLDIKLLSSASARVVRQTTEVLAGAKVKIAAAPDGGGGAMAPGADTGGPFGAVGPRSLINRMTGAPGFDEPTQPAPSTPSTTATTASYAAAAAFPERFFLSAYILIDTPEHGILNALASADGPTRQWAFESLKCFRIIDTLPGGADGTFDPKTDPYTLIVNTAASKQPVSLSLVPFLQRQPDPVRVGVALARVVVAADEAASRQAAQALMDSKLPLETAITALTLPERHLFARRMYGHIAGVEPLVTGVMRWNTPQNPLIPWLAKHISEGELPAPQRWFEQISGEDQVLLLSLSTDRELALGGAAVLAASVGGNDEHAREVARTFDLITNRTADGARPEWQIQRRRILADRLRAAAGEYDLKLKIYAQPDPAAPPPLPDEPLGEPVEVIALGTVKLEPQGDGLVMAAKTLSLSSPPDQYVIRVDKLAELKNFPGERIQQLPVEGVAQTLDLASGGERIWQGVFTLPNGAKAQLILEPAK